MYSIPNQRALFIFVLFETGSHYGYQAGLKFQRFTCLYLTCLYLKSSGIKVVGFTAVEKLLFTAKRDLN